MNRDVKLLIEMYQSIYEIQTNSPAITDLGAGGEPILGRLDIKVIGNWD